jgi:hypothetical protein
MCANLICLEQVDRLNIGRDVEVPLSISVVSEAMNWLISLYQVSWRKVINQASYGQGLDTSLV